MSLCFATAHSEGTRDFNAGSFVCTSACKGHLALNKKEPEDARWVCHCCVHYVLSAGDYNKIETPARRGPTLSWSWCTV